MENLNAEQIKKALDKFHRRVLDSNLKAMMCEDEIMAIINARFLIDFQEQMIKELAEENERVRGILLKFTDIVHKWGNKNGYDTSEISLVPILNEETAIKAQIKADTVRKMQERLQLYFGTYVLGYKIPLTEALKAVNQIAKEMLEGE